MAGKKSNLIDRALQIQQSKAVKCWFDKLPKNKQKLIQDAVDQFNSGEIECAVEHLAVAISEELGGSPAAQTVRKWLNGRIVR